MLNKRLFVTIKVVLQAAFIVFDHECILKITIYESLNLLFKFMETINFKKSGGPIKFRLIENTGELGVIYSFELCKRKCLKPLIIYQGNNYPGKKYFHFLPCPVNDNDDRILKLSVEYSAFTTDENKNYLLSFEVYQDDNLIKSIERKGCFSNVEENVLLDFELKMYEQKNIS
jgi:hypothetical protein